MAYKNLYSVFLLVLLVSVLITLMFLNCSGKESFTMPGLTLIRPPDWFPQNAAKAYNKDDWKPDSYLERYPFKNKSYEQSDKLASTYRFWRN